MTDQTTSDTAPDDTESTANSDVDATTAAADGPEDEPSS